MNHMPSFYVYTLSQKTPPLYLNNSAKNEQIVLILVVQNSEEISRKKIINSPTSPQ